MNRRVVISCWLMCFVLLATLAVPIALGPVSEYPMVYLTDEHGQLVVLTRDELDHGDHPEPFAQCAYMVDRRVGPIPGLIEFYETASVFATPPIISFRDDSPSAPSRERVLAALIEHAKHDPAMIPYDPGQPPRTRFSADLLGKTVVRVGVIASLSTLMALLVGVVVGKPKHA